VSGVRLRCRVCESQFPATALPACPVCDGPLDAAYDWENRRVSRAELEARPQTMWRYAEALPHVPGDDSSRAVGFTPLQAAPRLSDLLGVELLLKLETANPTSSFKDRLAASAVAAAEAFGLETVCCVSGGSLGEALAARAEERGLHAVVLVPEEDAAAAGLARAHGATALAVRGGYDDCRLLGLELEQRFGWGFLDGNLGPFAVEGAKTVAFELAEQLSWTPPDAVVSPLASGTLFAKLAQGLAELAELGLAPTGLPQLVGAQAGGCPPLAAAFAEMRPPSRVTPRTEARSLAIGDPRYGDLALGAARVSGGSIRAVPEEQIRTNSALLAEVEGVFADSAAGVAVGALRDCVRDGSIPEGALVVLVVTGTPARPAPEAPRVRERPIPAEAATFLSAYLR